MVNRRTLLSSGAAVAFGAQGEHRPRAAPFRKDIFVGVQVAPNSVFDEGPDHMLDFMQREGGINTVCVSTHAAQGGSERPPLAQLADHGVPRTPNGVQPLASVWMPFDPRNFRGTSLRMPPEDPTKRELAGNDVLEKVIAPAHARGMKVYARHLEAFHENLITEFPTFRKVQQEDVTGKRMSAPCWNHPEYRAFWQGYVTDVIRKYDVDGLLLGSERDAPLEPLLHHAQVPYCFCVHCKRRAALAHVDARRGQEGMIKLHALVKSPDLPSDGMLTSILRLWLKYPEILAWESLQNDSKWSLYAELYRLGKRLRPSLEIGWHLPMYPLNHDLFTRAGWDYEELAKHCDFLKPSIYFDVNASRLHGTVNDLHKSYLREFDKPGIYDFILGALNLDSKREPTYAQSITTPFSSDYVYREAKRCVVGVKQRAKVYAGIGIDVPKTEIAHDAHRCYEAAKASLAAGSQGLLLSREYHFMRKDSLNAVRQAVAEAASVASKQGD